MRARRTGLCECGCGEATNPAPNGSTRNGWVKGEPVRYVLGHASRNRRRHNEYRASTTESGRVVRVHVQVAEHALGKPMPVGAEVHHVNEIKSDNRPENLVVCHDAAYHLLLHARARAYDACGHAGWRKCTYCKRWGPADQMKRPERDPHHAECRREYRRARKLIARKAV